MDGHQFAGSTQLLPQGPDADQGSAAVESLGQFLQGKAPEPGSRPVAPQKLFAWKAGKPQNAGGKTTLHRDATNKDC